MNRTRVLSIVSEYPPDADDRLATNLRLTLDLLEEAARFDPDVVCFPELHLQYGGDAQGSPVSAAIDRDGPELEALQSAAADLGAFVLVPTYLREDGELSNAAVLVDPTGEVAGICRKLAPTVGEIEDGVTPGSEVAVWDTELGRIGALICWDARYPEVGVQLAAAGADLVLFPTQGTSDVRLRTWAQYYGFHVVSCHKHGTEVFSPTGGVLGGTTTSLEKVPIVEIPAGRARVALTPLNTDCAVYSAVVYADQWDEIQREYGDALAFHGTRNDGAMCVESIDESVSIDEVEREFDLESMPTYEARTRKRIRESNPDSPLFELGD